MQIQVLGPVRVLDNCSAVALGGPRQQTVLAVMVAFANKTLSADRLIDEIWGEDPPRAAKNSLQSMVSNLRKTLDGDGISIDREGPGYVLRVPQGTLDVLEFRAMLDEARRLLTEDSEAAAAVFRTALGMWRGSPFAGLADDVPVLRAEVVRLEELRLQAVGYRIEADLAAGRHRELAGELETLIDAHPLREEFYHLQMLALYRSGRQAEALRVFTRLRRTLVDELGIDPSLNLQQLERQILQQDQSVLMDSAVAVSRNLFSHRARFVGREAELSEISKLVGFESSGGRVVLVRGEAGIGKSALISQFMAETENRARVLLGACDDLLTPQPLGPIWDIARDESSVAEPLSQGDRRAVMDALLDLLTRSLRPTVLVIEDTQWADEATLDVIKFLGRRIGRSNGILILTYRDGEVDRDHPLRQVIGELPPQNLVRIRLDPLSEEAIVLMIEDKAFDVGEVLSLTGGNPLFVTEVLASGIEAVPSSVQDSVLARASKLSPGARRVLDLVSVTPWASERSLVEEVLDSTEEQVDECVRQGLLLYGTHSVLFRHALQRRAIESSLSNPDRRLLNKQVLAALGDQAEPSLLVHHAREADDVESIIEFAPRAARAAVAIESHREALAHFRTLEPYLDRIPEPEKAAILDEWAREEFYLDNAESLDLLDSAIELHRSLADDRALARTLAFAVRVNEMNGRPDDAEACSVEAVDILESYPPTADLAFALSEQAWLGGVRGHDYIRVIELADRAIAMAEASGDELTMIRTLTFKGSTEYGLGDQNGLPLVEESFRRAELGGHRFEAVYALINMTGMAADFREVERAADLAQRTRDAAARYEIRPFEAYSQAMYAEILLWKGDWVAAEDAATEVLGSDAHAEAVAWRILGTLQARRGRSETRHTLDRIWSLAEASGEVQMLDPAASVVAEYLWVTGEDDPKWIARLEEVLDKGLRLGTPWPSGALAFWMWKLDRLATVPDGLADFYRWIVEGDYETAADFWGERGVPYEQALALMHGDEAAQFRAIRILEELGADATANRVRRSLLDRGVTVPRAKTRSTGINVAGLTARQAEVLKLLAKHLPDSEIADRLFVSRRTVENHVEAILMKLDVSNRDTAVPAARARGLLATP